MPQKAWLAFEDGHCFEGFSVGAAGETVGEAIFSTSMTGYVELLTDPSFWGQIVVSTFPHVGNHGVSSADFQSAGPVVAGLVMGDAVSPLGEDAGLMSLHRFLAREGVVAVAGIPTRSIALGLRRGGAKRAAMTTEKASPRALTALARKAPGMSGRSLSRFVTTRSSYRFGRGRRRVALIDYGAKRRLLESLAASGFVISVYPSSTATRDVLAGDPEAIVLSSGPGDPAAMGPEIMNTKELLGARVPILGVCLGAQLLGLASGAATFKLKFGHHGANHPVRDLSTGRIIVTAQNHGFAVRMDSLPADFAATHVSLNDGTLEGFCHRRRRILGLQFHPEGGPGPQEAGELVKNFLA